MTAIIKTLGPIHFEDLDPHRFEDLVRELIYDFREWHTIEATGKSGSDEGFDIRAWEKTQEVINTSEDEDEQGTHPTDGNLWMIQCKRINDLGPKQVGKIIQENLNKKSLPYGYILVAPTNFSKKSYDVFRDDLRKIGVMDFHIWGKAELEDMLYLPKNDRLLFAFFGISLSTKKRTHSTEKKYIINNKNKLAKILNDGSLSDEFRKSVLIRDINDVHYPFEKDCANFDEHKPWQEHIVFSFHPRGILIHARERYAYVDTLKKEWDFTTATDLISRQKEMEFEQSKKDHQKNIELQDKIRDFWTFLPRKNKAKLKLQGYIAYEDILAIDGVGDNYYDIPHIFVSFHPKQGPFTGLKNDVYLDDKELDITEYKRIKFFPKTFPTIKIGITYKDKFVDWDNETLSRFKLNNEWTTVNTLFDVDDRYDFLKIRDIIPVRDASQIDRYYNSALLITYKYKTTLKKYLQERGAEEKENIERQIGSQLSDEDKINVYEFERETIWVSK